MNMSREQRQEGQLAGARAKIEKRNDRAARAQLVDSILDHQEREKLPIAALSSALRLMEAITTDLQQLGPAETRLDLLRMAETAKILHGIGRLELGESTANTLTVAVPREELEARLARLRATDPQGAASQ